jgi:hypothetical protein
MDEPEGGPARRRNDLDLADRKGGCADTLSALRY